jgi:hypothetical protein
MLLRTAPQPTRAERLLNATKLHEILRIALDDLKVVEKDPRYKIDMAQWHSPDADETCVVCLAGATLAVSLQVNPDTDFFDPHISDHEAGDRLLALDSLRRGEVGNALAHLRGKKVRWDEQVPHCLNRSGKSYENPAWWSYVEAIHHDLVEADI